MYNLIISTILYGMTFTHTAGSFNSIDICRMAAKGLSGPNFMASCEVAILAGLDANGSIMTVCPPGLPPGSYAPGCVLPPEPNPRMIERDHAIEGKFDPTIVDESGVTHPGSYVVTNVTDIDNVKKGMVCSGPYLATSSIKDIDKTAKTITLSSNNSIDGLSAFACFWAFPEPNAGMNGINR